MVSRGPQEGTTTTWPPQTWVKIAVLGALFVAMNWWQLPVLVGKWRHDPDWSHGFLIPLFSLYLLYIRRHQLFAAARRVNLLGLVPLVGGILTAVLGFYPIRTYWISHVSMIIALLGLVLYLGGWRIIRVTWVPILFLVFAMPMPDRIYNLAALPLQEIAAKGAAGILTALGANIEVRASSLTVESLSGKIHPLTVAEACSGMRLLMAFLALGVAFAYIDDRPNWQRVVLVAAGVPIAVLCNVIRVAITSGMFVLDKPEFGQNFMHKFTGIVMLGPALLMLWGLSWLLRSMFVEEEPEEQTAGDGEAAEA